MPDASHRSAVPPLSRDPRQRIPRHRHPAAVAAAGLLALVGCTPPGGSGSVECSPSPTITSTPPTAATVGLVYTYWAQGYYNCFLGTCFSIEGVRLPPGAAVSSPYVTWVPSAEQAGRAHAFEIRTEDDFCGDSTGQRWSVTVYAAPQVASFGAQPAAVKPGESTQLVAVFSGGFGEIGGLGPVSSGVPVTTPALATSTAFSLNVTNPAGGSVSQTLVVGVFPNPPAITRFGADREVLTEGDSTILRWQVDGASSLRLDPGARDVTGADWAEVLPPADTEYTLTATNLVWGSRSTTTRVRVVAPPSIASFTAAPAEPGFQGSVDLTAVFAAGEGRIEGLGPVTSGSPVSSGPLGASTLFRLVVTNAAGAEVSRELLVSLSGPGTWSIVRGSPVVAGRYRHTATLLRDGRVFLAGGYGVFASDSFTTEFFDPETETFSPGPSLLTPRVDHVAALLDDGRVLLVGGNSEEARQSAEVFDPSVDSFARTAPPAYGWYTAAATLPGGHVLVLPSQVGQAAQRFHPGDGTFSSAGPLLAFHGHLQPVRLLDGRILIVDGNSHLWCELYDADSGAFTRTGTVRRWRPNFTAAPLPDGRVLVAGDVSPGTPAEVYDPTTGLFSDTGDEPAPGPFPQATPLADGTVLVEGGQSAEVFDPTAGAFRPTGGLWAAHGQHTATLLPDGRVLVVGGGSASPELYTP